MIKLLKKLFLILFLIPTFSFCPPEELKVTFSIVMLRDYYQPHVWQQIEELEFEFSELPRIFSTFQDYIQSIAIIKKIFLYAHNNAFLCFFRINQLDNSYLDDKSFHVGRMFHYTCYPYTLTNQKQVEIEKIVQNLKKYSLSKTDAIDFAYEFDAVSQIFAKFYPDKD